MSKGLEHDSVDASVSSDTLEAIREELTCSICLDVLVRPCVTACGHNFCRRCLRRAMKHSPACPDCREPIRLTGTGLRVNTRLWSAVQLLFPESANAPSSPLHEECIVPAQSSSPERQEPTPQQHSNPPNMLPTLQSHARRMRSEFEQLQDAFYSVHRVVRQRITETIREAALTPGPMPAPGAMRGNSRSLHSNRAHQHLQSYGELADVPFALQGNQVPTSAPRPYMPGLQGRPMTRTDAPSSGPPALYPSMGSSTLSHSSQPPPSNPMLVMSPHHSTYHSPPTHIAPQSMPPTMVPAPSALQAGSMVSAQSPVSNHAQAPVPPPNPGMLAAASGPSAGGSNPGSGAFLQDNAVWMDGLFIPIESVTEVVDLPLNSYSTAPWSAMPDNRLDDFSLVATPIMHQANMHLSPPVPPSSMVNTSRHMGLGSSGVIMGMPPMSRSAAGQPASMPVELHADDGQSNWLAWNQVQPIPMHRAGSSPMSYVQQPYWLPITE